MKSNITYIYSDYTLYEANEPAVYNPKDFQAIQYVLDKYSTIKNELNDYVNRKFDIQYRNPSAPEMTYPDSWKNVYFKNYLMKYKIGAQHFPITNAIMNGHPDITLAGITTLAPKSRLKMHCGETNAIIRCHMGLKVPGKLPELGLRVKNIDLAWEEGKVFAFNDAFQHEAWNDTDDYRYVLIFDIIRPEFAKQKTWVCGYCLGIEVMRFLLTKIGMYEKTPIWLRRIITFPFAVMMYLYLKLNGN